MKGSICSIGYINKIKDNVVNLRRKGLFTLFEDLKKADCVICGGSGRSMYSLNISMSQLAKIGDSKVVVTTEDTGFPGRDMYNAAHDLEKRYDHIMLLIISGSGESGDPKTLVEDLKRYIDETNSEKFSMGIITSRSKSSIASIVQDYGTVITLEGRTEEREREERSSWNKYSETGIMGDVFELSSLSVLQAMSEVIYKNGGINEVYELFEEEFPVIGEIVDKSLETNAHKVTLNHLERRSDLFLGGRGTANEVAKMSAIRLFHIKKALGDNVYIARGVNTPRPRAGDLEILISYTGETKSVVRWCNDFRRLGGTVLLITGTENSTIYKGSDYRVTLKETVEPPQPRRFYTRAAYMLSPLPVLLTQRLEERGLKLPEYVLNWYHSIIQ